MYLYCLLDRVRFIFLLKLWRIVFMILVLHCQRLILLLHICPQAFLWTKNNIKSINKIFFLKGCTRFNMQISIYTVSFTIHVKLPTQHLYDCCGLRLWQRTNNCLEICSLFTHNRRSQLKTQVKRPLLRKSVT